MDMFRAQHAEGEALNKLAQSYGVMPFGITPYWTGIVAELSP